MKIHKYICNFYYTEENVETIQSMAKKYFQDIYGQEVKCLDEEQSELICQFYKNNLESIYEYIYPLFPENHLIHRIISNLRFQMEYYSIYGCPASYNYDQSDETIAAYGFDQSDIVFKMFFEKEIENIKKIRNKKIDRYEKILKSYLFNKRVSVLPGGVRIYNENGKLVHLNNLSSGEKKIAFLIFMAVFHDDATLIIDEPELSLSLIWQSNLLPSIYNSNKNRKLIVATHSPYILEDKKIQKFIHPLYIKVVKDNDNG